MKRLNFFTRKIIAGLARQSTASSLEILSTNRTPPEIGAIGGDHAGDYGHGRTGDEAAGTAGDTVPACAAVGAAVPAGGGGAASSGIEMADATEAPAEFPGSCVRGCTASGDAVAGRELVEIGVGWVRIAAR